MKSHICYALHRFASAALIAICLMAIEGVRPNALSASKITVRRITSDGVGKYGIMLSGGGTTVGWLEVINDPKLSPQDIVIVKAAATDGSWNKELFRSSNGAWISGLRGPHYDPSDTYYNLKQGGEKIVFSRDGTRMVLQIDEWARSRHYDYWDVIDVRSGAGKLMPIAIPPGMGTYTGYTNYDAHGVWLTNGTQGYTLSEDGRFIVYSIKAFGVLGGNGKSADALVAMNLDTGAAVRIAGYRAMDSADNLILGDPDYTETRVSSAGNKVVFACNNAYYVGDFNVSPLQRVTAGESSIPQLVGGGQYVAEEHTGAFYPVAGDNKVSTAVPGRGGFDFPFWDGEAGFITHPHLSHGDEVGIVRASGYTPLIKAGEEGLPPGWRFGVMQLSSAYTYSLISADGKRVLLSLVSPDGKQDLFLLDRGSTRAAVPATPTPPAPPAAAVTPAVPATPITPVPAERQPMPPPSATVQTPPTPPPPVSPPPAVSTGARAKHTLTTGQQTAATFGSVTPTGGTVEVTGADNPIRGFGINVPEGAYSAGSMFSISSAPITSHDLGPEVEIITPLIRVDNGGAAAAKPMTVNIPVNAPEGYAILAFFYDEKTGALEPMPLREVTPSSITVLTSHFSSFFVGRISEKVLPSSVNSGFKPEVDDWQTINEGSFITPGGHCTGQSITAMWYYFEKALRNEPHLFNRYDNNGIKNAATPRFWQDDNLAVRLISTVWRDLTWDSDQRMASLKLSDMKANRAILNAFRFSIYITGEPQLAEIFRFDSKDSKWHGHALIVYKVEDNRLFVADPNSPGQANRYIQFDPAANAFIPYFSGETSSSQGVNYTHICYVAKTALIPWAKLGERWKEFEQSFDAKPQDNARLIGKDYYPPYKLVIVEPEGGKTELADYHVTDRDRLKVQVESPAAQVRCIPYRDGRELALNTNGEFSLEPGYNEIDFYVQGAAEGYWRWLDFQRFKIFRNTLAIEPSELKGKTGASYDLSARMGAGGAPPDVAKYEWRFGDGTAPEAVSNAIIQHNFENPGRYTISLRATDSQGKVLGEASAIAVIEQKEIAPEKTDTRPGYDLTGRLHKIKGISLIFRADYIRSDDTRADGYEFRMPRDDYDYHQLPIEWEENRFHGSFDKMPSGPYNRMTLHGTITGSVKMENERLYLDLEARTTTTWPDAQDPPPYGGSSLEEFKVKGIPLLNRLDEERSSADAGWNLTGDLVRDLGPSLTVNIQSHNESTSVKSIEWRGSYIRVELTPYVGRRESY